MKTLFLSLLLCFGVNLCADYGTIFRDEDTGLVMQIPPGLKRTWNISNCDNGMEFNVFQSDFTDEKFFAIILGKLPKTNFLEEESGEMLALVIDELQSTLSEGGTFFDETDIESFELELLPSDDYIGQRLRLHISDEDMEVSVHIDLFFFEVEDCLCLLATGIFPEGDPLELEEFTSRLIASIMFIQE